jgi:hypothetical protein
LSTEQKSLALVELTEQLEFVVPSAEHLALAPEPPGATRLLIEQVVPLAALPWLLVGSAEHLSSLVLLE